MPARCLALFLLMTAGSVSMAAEDSGRFLEDYGTTGRYRLGNPTRVKISPDGKKVLFLRSGPRSFVQDLFEFDVASGTERRLLDADALLGGKQEALTADELARRERMRMSARGIATYSLSRDGKRLLVPLSGQLYVVEIGTGASRRLPIGNASPIDARFSRDSTKIAYVSGGELFVISTDNGKPMRLTDSSTENIENGLAEFVAQEEMDRMHGYWWSPDGQHLAYQQTDVSPVQRWTISDPTHPEKPSRTWPYPRPGKNNAVVRLGVIPAGGGETTWVQWDNKAWPYLAKATWPKGAPLTILVQNRTQTEEKLLTVDHLTGRATELLTETDTAWINIDAQMPRWLKGGKGFLWTTERRGAWQLELHRPDGSLEKVLTPIGFGYRGLAALNETEGNAYVAAGEDPTQRHIYRVPLNGEQSDIKQLTNEPGLHSLTLSKDGSTQLRGHQSLSTDFGYTVYKPDGGASGVLKSAAATPPFRAKVEMTTVGQSPELRAAVIRPDNFEQGTRLPVIVSVYGGPHAQTVTASRGRYLMNQWLANRGYIVVSIDGRGTPSRGREWERAIKGNLIKAPLEDQVRGLRLLGEKYPEMDLSRVGIYGWSFGGYFSAMAVAQRPDVFHAGVAGAPVVDWRDYDTHYTERYMGLPDANPQGYHDANVLTHASELRRPLLLIHGTADDNVYFLHSMKLSGALFRAGKPHEFLPLAGFTHMVPDPLVTRRLYGRIADFLDHHLMR